MTRKYYPGTDVPAPTPPDYYCSQCCKAKIKNVIGDEGTGHMECTACHSPCDITLTNEGVKASVQSNHSLGYPTSTVSENPYTAAFQLEEKRKKRISISRVRRMIELMWIEEEKDKTGHDVGWNSALAELDTRLMMLEEK